MGAQETLDEARALCLPLGATPVLARIETIATRLAGTDARPADLPANLSPREAEVLRLVAAGMSNAQIADRLSLSPRTVKAHIANIYAKIGVHNRASATQFAIAHSLA